MKFYLNVLIIGVVALVLFEIIITFAERSSDNNVYILLILVMVIMFIARLLLNFIFFKSIKKGLDATPQELLSQSVKMEKYYVGEIIMIITGVVLFNYGYKEYNISGFSGLSIIYFIGSLICLIIIIKSLISKKTKIEKMKNPAISEQNNIIKINRFTSFMAIGLVILGILYEFLN